jgi:hypothetical protein
MNETKVETNDYKDQALGHTRFLPYIRPTTTKDRSTQASSNFSNFHRSKKELKISISSI